MRGRSKTWLIVLGVLLLVPLGIRALTWQRAKARAVDPGMAQAGEVLFKHDWKVEVWSKQKPWSLNMWGSTPLSPKGNQTTLW